VCQTFSFASLVNRDPRPDVVLVVVSGIGKNSPLPVFISWAWTDIDRAVEG
jgi:hypothetical protein